ncbi:hypothetical protein E2C01_053918 [Portunus trituberculatus]|uniref:Uncharacterized protein n=1 Tax=Portunus trituberculatus TaxID=210409 RepID=A0A5B7GQN8_PORTR|nr:hypothetical protein [Portunus trituberculatus]
MMRDIREDKEEEEEEEEEQKMGRKKLSKSHVYFGMFVNTPTTIPIYPHQSGSRRGNTQPLNGPRSVP